VSVVSPDQISLLPIAPTASQLHPVGNPPLFDGSELILWLRTKYCGNKPTGGLWTSSHTPHSPWVSDWAQGLARNELIRQAVPEEHRTHPAWLLTVSTSARPLTISSLADARAFTKEFDRGRLPMPSALRSSPFSIFLTRCQTDWEKAFSLYDAVSLTAEAADEIAWAQVHAQSDTAFHAWNCESTLWGGWHFVSVRPL
jgi:hypothetical protein